MSCSCGSSFCRHNIITGLLTHGPVPMQKQRHTETKRPGPRQKFKILIFFFHGFLTFPSGFLIVSSGFALVLLERHGSVLMTLSIKRSVICPQSVRLRILSLGYVKAQGLETPMLSWLPHHGDGSPSPFIGHWNLTSCFQKNNEY